MDRIFEKDECVCKADRMGKKCDQKLDLEKQAQLKEADKKKLVWTTIPSNDSSLLRYSYKHFGYQDTLNNYFSKDNDFFVFPQTFFKQMFRNAVPRYGTYVVAVNKKEALDSKVIAYPETYNTIEFKYDRFVTPICSYGYSPVSSGVFTKFYDQT